MAKLASIEIPPADASAAARPGGLLAVNIFDGRYDGEITGAAAKIAGKLAANALAVEIGNSR